jgi:hypothetical protein
MAYDVPLPPLFKLAYECVLVGMLRKNLAIEAETATMGRLQPSGAHVKNEIR